MRYRIKKYLICPNSQSSSLKIYALEVLREDLILRGLSENELKDSDDIRQGLIINDSNGFVYPILNFIPVLLNFGDIEISDFRAKLESLRDACPKKFAMVINHTLERIGNFRRGPYGEWNVYEMKYYDEAIKSEVARLRAIDHIENVPLWRVLLPRIKQIFHYIGPLNNEDCLLEIGCGNARTVTKVFSPLFYHYSYIGVDISYNRLLVAKKSLPAGDFVQASALNLPFSENIFQAVLSFGTLHHLPNPAKCLHHCDRLLKYNGLFAFYEPIRKPKLLPKCFSSIKKVLFNYEHSIHDKEIDSDKILKLLMNMNYKVINLHYLNSVFKTLFEIVLSKIKFIKSGAHKTMNSFILFIDQIFIKSICKISKRFGPHAIIVVARKSIRSYD